MTQSAILIAGNEMPNRYVILPCVHDDLSDQQPDDLSPLFEGQALEPITDLCTETLEVLDQAQLIASLSSIGIKHLDFVSDGSTAISKLRHAALDVRKTDRPGLIEVEEPFLFDHEALSLASLLRHQGVDVGVRTELRAARVF